MKAAQCKHSTPLDYQPGMLSGRYNFKIYNICFISFYTISHRIDITKILYGIINTVSFVSELIREIRETNKNREDELAMKVKSLLEEKNNQQVKKKEI